jgi:hypothetical protein
VPHTVPRAVGGGLSGAVGLSVRGRSRAGERGDEPVRRGGGDAARAGHGGPAAPDGRHAQSASFGGSEAHPSAPRLRLVSAAACTYPEPGPGRRISPWANWVLGLGKPRSPDLGPEPACAGVHGDDEPVGGGAHAARAPGGACAQAARARASRPAAAGHRSLLWTAAPRGRFRGFGFGVASLARLPGETSNSKSSSCIG